MLAQELASELTSPHELIAGLKETNGYHGITGTVRFDEDGCIIPNGNEILIFRDDSFGQVNTNIQE